MAEPDEQAKQNLLAALDGFREAFGDRFRCGNHLRWLSQAAHWMCEFFIDRNYHTICSDDKCVWMPLKIHSARNTPEICMTKFQTTPEQFVQMMRILEARPET